MRPVSHLSFLALLTATTGSLAQAPYRAQLSTAIQKGGADGQRAVIIQALPNSGAVAANFGAPVAVPAGAVGFPKDNPGYTTGLPAREPVVLRDATNRGGAYDPEGQGLNLSVFQPPGGPYDPDGVGMNVDVPTATPAPYGIVGPGASASPLLLTSPALMGLPAIHSVADFSAVRGLMPSAAGVPGTPATVAPSFDQAIIAALSVKDGVFDAGKGAQFGKQFGDAVKAYNDQLAKYQKEQLDNLNIAATLRMLSPQVLIKARIIQVSRSHLTDVGTVLDYISRNPLATDRPSYILGPNGMLKQQNLEIKTVFPVPIPAAGPGATLEITGKHIDAIITAIQQDFRVDTLAAPQMTVLNDELVNFTAGTNLPFFYGRNTTLDSANRTQELFFKHVGVQLTVVPHVLARQEVAEAFDSTSEGANLASLVNSGKITPEQYKLQRQRLIDQASAGQPIYLNIGYRLSDPGTATFTTNTNSNQDITVNAEQAVRAGTSKVRVHNGCGIVISGLINEAATDTEFKVPVLGDIPIIANAFRRKTRTRDKFETIIFIEARIVGTADPAADNYEYADRHLPNGPCPGMPHPLFSQVPLAPLEQHVYPTHTQTWWDWIKRPFVTAYEIIK